MCLLSICSFFEKNVYSGVLSIFSWVVCVFDVEFYELFVAYFGN